MGYNIQRQIRVATTATLWHQREHMRPYEAAVDDAINRHGKGSPEHVAASTARSAAWLDAKKLGPYARFTGAAMAALHAIADHAGELNPADAPEGLRVDRYRPGGTREGWVLIDTIQGEAGTFSRSAIQQGLIDLRATQFQPAVKVDGKVVPMGPAFPVEPALVSEVSDGKSALTFTVLDLTTPYINKLHGDGVVCWSTTAAGGRKLVEALPYVRASSRGHKRVAPGEELDYAEPGSESGPAMVGNAATHAAASGGGMFGEYAEYVADSPLAHTDDFQDDGPVEGELEVDGYETPSATPVEDIVDAETVEREPCVPTVATVTTLPVATRAAETPEQDMPATITQLPSEVGRAVRATHSARLHHKEVLAWGATSEHAATAVRAATDRALASGIAEPLLAREFGTVAGLEESDAVEVQAFRIAKRAGDAAALISRRVQWQDTQVSQARAVGDR
ncbi:MAG: hypothetical protein ACOH17_04360 [Cellulomonas sp.]